MENIKDISELYFDYKYDFMKDEDCIAYHKTQDMDGLSDQPLISFIMPVHNEYDEMNCTINSLLEQNFNEWELIIWDNSDTTELPYKIATNIQRIDSRIRAIKSPFPMGFTKAFSEAIFNYARGTYCLYLGTGDLLVPGRLRYLSSILQKRHPDVVFARTYAAYSYEESRYAYLEYEENKYEEFDDKKRSEAMFKIMKSTFYNSFTNIMRTDFLKANVIDFWTDYPSDCAGMQYVIRMANRIIITDSTYYISTVVSSQTRGSYYIGSCYMFAQQWSAAKEVLLSEKYDGLAVYQYVSRRIYNNFLSLLEPLVCGKWRNRYMEKAEIGISDIVKELEYVYTEPSLVEMVELSNIEDQIKMLSLMGKLNSHHTNDEIEDSFINPLVRIGEQLLNRDINIQVIVNELECFILKTENIAALGAEIYVSIMNSCKRKADDCTVFKMHGDVLTKLENYLSHLADGLLKKMIIMTRVENMKKTFV